MRLPINLRTILLGDRGACGLVFRQPESDGLAGAARHGARAGAGRTAAAAAGAARSSIIAPVAIALTAIRDAADRGAPRTFAGKADNPVSQILQNADIGWTASRGPIAATGAQDVLSLATPLTGTLNVTGSLSAKATGAVGDALGGLLGGDLGKKIGSVNIKNLNASAEIKGNVVDHRAAETRRRLAHRAQSRGAGQSRRLPASRWRARASTCPAQVKPMIDKTVADQIAAVQARIRNDPALEQNARTQWAKACRSIPLQGTGATSSLPALWLEMRPTRAIAAQPRVDASAVTLTLGIEAETRITPAQTKPDCPFPATISIIPPTPGGVSIGVPIDMPFTEINKIVEAQFAGKTFPEDGSGLGRRHRQARQRGGLRRPAADLAAGQRQGEEELLRIRRRGQCAYLGQARARSGAADAAADQRRTRGRIRGRVRPARAPPRARRCRICSGRWPTRPPST